MPSFDTFPLSMLAWFPERCRSYVGILGLSIIFAFTQCKGLKVFEGIGWSILLGVLTLMFLVDFACPPFKSLFVFARRKIRLRYEYVKHPDELTEGERMHYDAIKTLGSMQEQVGQIQKDFAVGVKAYIKERKEQEKKDED